HLDDAEFGLAMITDRKTPTRKWTTLQATAGLAELLGSSDFEVSGTDISVAINRGVKVTNSEVAESSANTKYQLQIANDTVGALTFTYQSATGTATISRSNSDAVIRTKIITALEGMQGIGAGNVAVTGSRSKGFTIEFQGALAGTNVTGLTVSTPASSSGSVTVSQLTAAKVGVSEIQSITIIPSQIPTPTIRTTVTQISNGASGGSHVQEVVISKPSIPTPSVSAIVTETTDGYTSTSQIRQLTISKPVQTKPTVTTSVTEASRGVSASNAVQQIAFTKQTPTKPEIKATVSELTAGKTSEGTVTGLTIFAANAAQGTYSLSYGGKTVTIIWSQNDVTNNSRKLRNALQKLTGVSDVSVRFDQRTITTEQRHAIRIPGFTGIITAQDVTLGATFRFDPAGSSSAGLNEVQQVTFVTAAASGTFRLSLPYNGRTYTTAALSLAASASSIQTAMNTALSGAGTVTVSRTVTTDGFSLNITFTGSLGSRNLELLKVETMADVVAAGGTFTLSYGGQTTSAIAMNANTATQATDIQTALRSLSTIGAGNVQVTYDSASTTIAPQYNVTFIGSLAGTNVAAITATALQLQYASVQTRMLENGKATSNEKQTVTLNSGSASGTFRLSLTVNGRLYTTADLAFNATASSIQTALNTALGAAGAVSVNRPGTSGSTTFDVTFSGALAGKDIAPLTIHTDVVTPKAG
ncbi:MAG: hypothetical protein WCK86_23465, partial [Planctomycetia bacterium]